MMVVYHEGLLLSRVVPPSRVSKEESTTRHARDSLLVELVLKKIPPRHTHHRTTMKLLSSSRSFSATETAEKDTSAFAS